MAGEQADKYQKFDGVLAALKEEIDRLLAQQGTTIGPLNEAYKNLEQQASDIRAVENHVESIRREVIDPVNQSLSRANRAAWAFGIVGVLIGGAGIGFSILHNPNEEALAIISSEQTALADAESTQTETIRDIRESEASQQRMLADLLSIGRSETYIPTSVEPVDGERTLDRFQVVPVLSGENLAVSLRLTDVRSETPEGGEESLLIAEFELHQNGAKQGQSEIDRRVRVISNATSSRSAGRDRFKAFENDVIVIDEIHRFALTRVLSEEPLHRASGDGRTTAFVLPQ